MSDFVKVYEFIQADLDNIEHQIKEAFKDCKNIYFNSYDKMCYIYDINNKIFTVSSDDDVLKLKSVRFFKNALGDINKLAVKIFANVSDLNIC